MMVTPGVDIVAVERVRNAVERWGARFTRRVFTGRELDYAFRNRNPYQHLAARFAAKEAVAKAVGDDVAPFWNEIEISRNGDGVPLVVLHGRIKSLCLRKNITSIQVSISHTDTYAVASAIAEKKGTGSV